MRSSHFLHPVHWARRSKNLAGSSRANVCFGGPSHRSIDLFGKSSATDRYLRIGAVPAWSLGSQQRNRGIEFCSNTSKALHVAFRLRRFGFALAYDAPRRDNRRKGIGKLPKEARPWPISSNSCAL